MEDKPKLTSIKTLAGDFKSRAELQEFSNSLFVANKKYIEKVQQLEDEIKHLQLLLTTTTPLLVPNSDDNCVEFVVVPEKQIVEIQIELIKRRGMDKELCHDDVKKLEALVRTKKMIDGKDEDKTIKGKSKPIYSDTQLMQLATQGLEEKKDNNG